MSLTYICTYVRTSARTHVRRWRQALQKKSKTTRAKKVLQTKASLTLAVTCVKRLHANIASA